MKLKNNLDPLVDQITEMFNTHEQTDDQQFRDNLKSLIRKYSFQDNSEQNHEVTIQLSDIRGFTTLSEHYSPNQILHMLNHYFSRMNSIILKYHGMIDKYMGDAIMVVFGMPEASEKDAVNAIACAIEMQLVMDEVNQYNKQQGYPEIFAGIGINTDTVSAGQLGSDIHNEFTVIGDGVNLASRIESYSLRGQILIGDQTYHKVRDHIETGCINKVQVKGKSEPVSLYEVMSIHVDDHTLSVPKREIRNSIRLQIEQPFEFNIVENKNVLNETISAMIKDISYNGLFAVIEEKIEVLTNIRFSLALNLLGGQTRDIYGKIVSVRQLQHGYGCGIEFTSMDDESQQAIKSFIDRIIGGV